MWKTFCEHVVKVEKEYMAKDGIVEDIVDEVTFTPDSDEEDLIDEYDRQIIDRELQQSTTTEAHKMICTNQRRDLLFNNWTQALWMQC